MLIVGAKGFAKELIDIVSEDEMLNNLTFYDDVNSYSNPMLYNNFPILSSFNQARDYFKKIEKRFTIGIGNVYLRQKMYSVFTELGGVYTSTISNEASIGKFDVKIEKGANILPGVKISNGVKIGIGVLIYYNSVVTHDVEIGDFCEISPSVNLLGNAKIGSFCHIATNAVIFPNVNIGNNVIVAAGAVVRQDVPDNVMIAGVPGKIIKTLN